MKQIMVTTIFNQTLLFLMKDNLTEDDFRTSTHYDRIKNMYGLEDKDVTVSINTRPYNLLKELGLEDYPEEIEEDIEFVGLIKL